MPVRVPERGRSATSPCQVYFNGSASCVSAFSTDHDHGGLPHSGSTQNGGLESPLDNKCHRDTFDSDQNEASNDGSFIYIDSSDSANWAGEADRKTCGARKSAESSNSSTPVRRRLDFSCLTVDSHPKHFGSPLEPVNVYATQRSSHDHLSMVTTQMHQESNTAAAEWRHKGSGHSRVSDIYRRSCIHLQGENTKPGGRMLLSARSPYTASLARPVTTKNLFSRTNPGPNPNSNPRHTIVQSKRSNKPQERKALSRRGKSHVPVEDSGTCGQRTKSTPVYHSNRTAGYNYGLPLHSPSAPKKKKKKPAGEQRISVCVRKRPLTQAEDTRRETDVVTTTQDGKCVMVHESKEAVDLTQYILQHTFYFDQVFGEESSNEEVYQRTAGPLVLHMLKGGKATCFAYGQTGAGKTHTMLGSSRRSPGLYALAARDIFTHLYATLVPSPLLVYVSFFEIYCRHLYDLLDHRKRLFAREDGKVFQIPGLREFRVETVDSLLEVISWGTEERTQGVSGLNPVSSRSHALLQIQLRSPKQQLAGRLWFVDLAGSERASDSRELDRQSRIEGAEINQSLLALKECIRSLDQKQSHTPFRQSKLTQVLKDSFVGNSKTCMIANISPGHLATEHTLNTLRYADRVKELRKQGSVRGGIRSKGTQTSGSSNGASTNSRDKSPTKRPKLTHRETLSPNTPTKRLPRGGPILSYSPKNSTAERSKGIRGREEEIGVVEHLIPVRCHRESLDPNTPTRRLPAAGTILCSTWRAGETAEKERHLRCYHQQLQQFTPLATSQSVRPSESPSLGISLSSFSNLLTTSASSSSTKPALSPAVYPGLQELLNVYGAGVEVRAGVIEGHHNHLPVRIYSSIESIGRHQNRSGEDDVDETGGLRGHCGVPANKAETRDLERGHESKEEEFGEAAGEEEARERGKQELCSNDSESWKPSDSNILFHHNQPRGDPPPNLAQAERPLSPACEPTDNHSTDVTLGDFFLESKDKHPSSSEFPPNGVSLVSTSEQESGRTGFAMKQHVSSSLPPPPRLLHAFTTQTRNEVPAGVSNRCPTTDPAFVSKAQISATEFLPSPEVYGHSVVKTSTSSPDESSLGSLSCVMDPLSLSQLQVDCQAATDSFLCGEKNNIPPRLQEYNEVEVTQTLMAQYYVELTEDVEGGAHLLWGMRKAKPAFQVVADGRFQELGDMKLVRTQLENKGLGTSVSPLKPHNSDTWSILHSSQHHQDASSQIISSQIQLECLQGTSNQTVPPISTSQSESNLNQLEMESRQSHSLGSYHSNYRLSPSVNETGNRQSLQESTSSQHIRPSIQSSPADLDHAKWCVAKAHLVQLQRMETLCHNEETLMHQQHEMAFGDYINCLEEIMERKARCIQSMRAQLQQYLKPSPSDHQNIRDPTNNVFG